MGLPVLRLVSYAYMPSPLPRQVRWGLFARSLHRQRPSLCNSQVGFSCHYFFGACSAFTHVMACTLAESPSDPLHRKLRQLRCLRRRFDCYRVERTSSRAGVSPAGVQRLSRRTVTPIDAAAGFRIADHPTTTRNFPVAKCVTRACICLSSSDWDECGAECIDVRVSQ